MKNLLPLLSLCALGSLHATPLAQSSKIKAAPALAENKLHPISADLTGKKQICLQLNDLGDPDSDWANWINPTFHHPDGQTTPVTKSHLASFTQDWKTPQFGKNVLGKPLKVGGKTYPHGIGSHANAELILNVPDGATRFTAQIGLDDGGSFRKGKPTGAHLEFLITLPRDPNAPPPAWEPKGSPESVSLKHFQLREDAEAAGLEVTLWANSPHLYNPTNIDIDHAGRIWVAEGVNYRRHKGRRPNGDRIAVLQDTNGDGKADKSHTFVQEKELVAPLGVAVIDNQIIVSQPPNLIVYTDVNRNLVFEPAIDKREILLTGFNAANHDHSLHSVTAGPDGKWYFNNGNCGGIFTDKSNRTFRIGGNYYKSGGGDWFVDHRKANGKKSDDGFIYSGGFSVRINPDGTDAEIIGHGYRNSYEHCTTSLGHLFQNDNDDPPACRVSYVLEGSSAGYFTRQGTSYKLEKRPGQAHPQAHWRQADPGTFDVGDIYGGGSPTGIVYYENGALGQAFNGTLLSAEAGKNVIYGYQPQVKGAAYQLNRTDFLTSNPAKAFDGSDFVGGHAKKKAESAEDKERTLFRPSDLAVGADGALYVSDWYDPRVGGHGDRDETCSGAIYRIAPKGFKPNNPDFDLKTTDGALTALQSPAINVRNLGFKALINQGPKALSPLQKLLSHPNENIASRAIWILPHLGEDGLKAAQELLKSDQENTRVTAYKALRAAGKNILPHAQALANDPSAALRREVAISLRGKLSGDTPPSITEVASVLSTIFKHDNGQDKNHLEAIGLAAEGHENALWQELKKAHGHPDPAQWSDAFARLTWRLWPTDAIPDHVARAKNPQLTPAQRSFAIESLAFIDDPQSADALIKLASTPNPSKNEAGQWIIKRALSAWSSYNLMPKLKAARIYDPNTIQPTPIMVAAPTGKPSFTPAQALALKGDPTKGKATLMRCIMCHEVGGIGPSYGPSLKGWAKTQTPDVIARSIIAPSADIAHGYGGHSIHLKAGGEIHGLIINNGNPTIIVSTGGVQQIIPKGKIEKVTPLGRSLMLSADQLGLKAQDVADLIEYLKTY